MSGNGTNKRFRTVLSGKLHERIRQTNHSTVTAEKKHRPATARPDLTGRSTMRRYHPWRQQIELRPRNRGKTITDQLPTVDVDPTVLDIAAQIKPLTREGVPFFRSFWAVMLRVAFPSWIRRGLFWRYFRGIFGPDLRMNLTQAFANRFRVASEPRYEPAALKEEIRAIAAEHGFALCGFTHVDRRLIADGADDKFPYDTAVVLGMEMDPQLLDEMPAAPGRLVDFEGYIAAGRHVLEVARQIRSLGYRCVARTAFDSWVKYVPHAVNAGLAELGANGLALTPQFGPRQRWCMISLDAEIEPDPPADFGIAAYCEECRLCVHGCPGRALSEEKVWWRGVHKHKLNPVRCWPYFVKFDGCSICLKVCPLHRYGYDDCIEAYRKDGTILGRPPGIDRFLKRREQRRTTVRGKGEGKENGGMPPPSPR